MTLLLALFLAGCGSDEPVSPTETPAPTDPASRAKAVGAERSAAPAPRRGPSSEGPGYAQRDTVTIADLEGAPALVALVVLDTVRSDRTAFCGGDKPNTPTLDRIRERASAWTCGAVAPAPWTLPSHASYFTGAPTAEHKVHTHGIRLDDRFETLAELYAARGYQTLMVSGNPVFQTDGGFYQGFDRVVASRTLAGPLREGALANALSAELEAMDAEAPLFLVVNIFDAHDPYPEVPDGLAWARRAPQLGLKPHVGTDENPYYRYVTGAMEPEEGDHYVERVRNSYDHAIAVADRSLARVMKELREADRLAHGHRVVITSDHGEHLGEHGLLRHGSATWEPVTRVPFVYLDSTAETLPDIRSPFSATNAFFLLRDGRLPTPALVAQSASGHNDDDFKPSWETVSVWTSADTKLMSFDGEARYYDLFTDPGEVAPQPTTGRSGLKILEARTIAHRESIAEALKAEPDAEMMEMLQEVGYVQ